MRFRFFVCETLQDATLSQNININEHPLHAVDVLHEGDVRPV